MSNEVTVHQTKDYTALEAWASSQTAQAVEGDLLLFKKGKWSRGEDKTAVPEGTKVLVNIDSMSAGWVRWWDSKPVEYRIAPVIERQLPVTREQLGDLDHDAWETDARGDPKDPWSRTMRAVMRDAKGELLTFATSSAGGRNALAKLSKAFALAWRKHPGEFPVVTLGSETYEHKEFGEIDKPSITVVDWSAWDIEQKAKGKKAIAAKPPTKTEKELNDELPNW
jgi:hypothetical protein